MEQKQIKILVLDKPIEETDDADSLLDESIEETLKEETQSVVDSPNVLYVSEVITVNEDNDKQKNEIEEKAKPPKVTPIISYLWNYETIVNLVNDVQKCFTQMLNFNAELIESNKTTNRVSINFEEINATEIILSPRTRILEL